MFSFAAHHHPSGSLGTCAKSDEVKETQEEGKNKPGMSNRVLGQNLAGFMTCFNLSKSKYDWVFKHGGGGV